MIMQKNEQALAVLHSRYYEPLCAAAYKKIPDEPLVEEMVQDVFVAVWEKSAFLDVDGDIKNYLYATLRNKVLYELRSRVAKTALKAMHLPFRERSDTDVSDLLQAKELEQRLHAVIEELSPQSREAFKLSRFDQLPYKLIAARLNVSVGTVEKHISKALRILRKELSETDYLLLIGLVLSGISLTSADNAHLLLVGL